MFLKYKSSCQRGFLLPAALFLLVALSALAIGIARISTQSSTSIFREAIAVQTFYAAESGMQWGMNQVLFPGADQAQAITNCAAVENLDPDIREIVLVADGLNGCSVDVSCSSAFDSTGTIAFYNLISSARCGEGQVFSERTIQASAYISE